VDLIFNSILYMLQEILSITITTALLTVWFVLQRKKWSIWRWLI